MKSKFLEWYNEVLRIVYDNDKTLRSTIFFFLPKNIHKTQQWKIDFLFPIH